MHIISNIRIIIHRAMRAIIRPTMPENPCGASKYTNSTFFWANTHFCDFVGACWADCQNGWILTCECIYDAYIAMIVSKCRNDCSIASQLYPIYVYSTKWKTGAGFLPNTRFSALNPVFSHFLKIAVFFIFWPVPKPSAPCKFLPPRPYPHLSRNVKPLANTAFWPSPPTLFHRHQTPPIHHPKPSISAHSRPFPFMKYSVVVYIQTCNDLLRAEKFEPLTKEKIY